VTGPATASARPGRETPCIFCSSPTGGKGEHVWPKWFLKRWAGQGPFTRTRNGEPLMRRDGSPQRTPEMAPVTVPVCGSASHHDCNAWLNDSFENPAKRVIHERYGYENGRHLK